MRTEVKCKKLDEKGLGECWINNRKFSCANLLPNEKAIVEVEHNQI